MSYERLDGIVIKETNTGEADKFLTLLTTKKGKINVYAKNVRKNRNILSISSQFLCYSNFILFRNKEFFMMSSGDLIEPFLGIKEDINKLTYAAHFSEILYDVVQENQYSANILKLFLNTLHLTNINRKNLELVRRVFELKLMCLSGYSPNIQKCKRCNTVNNINEKYFDFKESCMICKSCRDKDVDVMPLLAGTVKLLDYIISANIKDVFKFDITDPILFEFDKLVDRYIEIHMEKKYRKLEFLINIKKGFTF